MKQLIANRDYIQKENLFFARVGEEIGVVEKKENDVVEKNELAEA